MKLHFVLQNICLRKSILVHITFKFMVTDWKAFDFYITGKGIPVRHVLGKSKMLLGLLEGIPTMLKGEVAMVFSLVS